MGLFGGDEPKPDGPKTVLSIPVQTVKPRPLRFFLQIYVLGEQNSQKDNSKAWLPRESDDGGLQIFFKDGTGMCNIVLEPNNIVIERHGQRPSLQYMLQESVMLHGVLDELHKVAFDEIDDVKDSDRLLILQQEALDKARESLPARKA